MISSGVWTADDTFTETYRLYETPFVWTTRFRFEGDQLFLETAANVGPVSQPQTLVAHQV